MSESSSPMTPSPPTDLRDAPAYSFPEAARHLGMPAATLRSWVLGATHRPGGSRIASKPLIRPPAATRGHISFNNLVEAHMLREMRTRSGVTMAALRTAITHAERELGIDRLLLRDELRTTGQNIIFDRLDKLTSLSKSGEMAMRQILAAHLQALAHDYRIKVAQIRDAILYERAA